MTTRQPLPEGYHKTTQHEWEIIANHEIQGVTPEMIDWWWDHIDNTERYKLWHPTDHVSFEWLVSPATNGHVGAIQLVQEYFNGIPENPPTLQIRWEDATGVDAEYSHVLLATGIGEPPARLMHEYEATPFGSRMRSHFHLPAETPEFIIKSLYEHNKQEMANFATFLPDLYQSSTDA